MTPRRPRPDDGRVCATWHRFWCWWWEMDATFVSRRALVIVIVLFTAFMAYGFHRLETNGDNVSKVVANNRANARRIEFEGETRDYLACVESNRDKARIVAFIRDLAGPAANRSPGARSILERAETSFAPEECPPEPTR